MSQTGSRGPQPGRDPHRNDRSVGAYSLGVEKRRPAWLIPLAILIGLLLLGLLLWALLHGGKKKTPVAVASPTATASVLPSPTDTALPTPTDTASLGAGTGTAAGIALVGGGGVAAHSATGTRAAAGQLGTVLFATNSAALTTDARKVIAAAAAAIKTQGAGTVRIHGYADVLGTSPANTKLAEARATVVRNALQAAVGTSAVHYIADAKGEADSVASNSTAAGRQQNRRASITFTP